MLNIKLSELSFGYENQICLGCGLVGCVLIHIRPPWYWVHILLKSSQPMTWALELEKTGLFLFYRAWALVFFASFERKGN
jgi:hypothetical protein